MRKRKGPIVEDDEIMAEVRKWKAAIWEESGGTIEGFLHHLHAYQEKLPPHLLVDRSGKGKLPDPSDDPKS